MSESESVDSVERYKPQPPPEHYPPEPAEPKREIDSRDEVERSEEENEEEHKDEPKDEYRGRNIDVLA